MSATTNSAKVAGAGKLPLPTSSIALTRTQLAPTRDEIARFQHERVL